MGYYVVVALVLVAGGLGLAYVTIDPFGTDQDRDEVAVAPEPSINDQTSADSMAKSSIQGSAARRMDDFGSGPGGVAVTVPLKNRHQQAYSGNTVGGGGGKALESSPNVRLIERDVAALRDQIEGEKPAETDHSAGNSPPEDIAPSFDVVRVDPTGSTVVAGRALPGADVEIRAGDEVIDRVTAGVSGEWVSTPAKPLSSGDQELSLTAFPEIGEPIESRQIVVVSVPEIAAENAQSSEPVQPDAAVVVVLDKEEGGEGRILQAPDKLQSAGDERLALKVVDYDDEGAIRLTGEAPPGVPVRIYIDNQPAALVIGNSKGNWITTLDQELPAGDYTLRLDQLDTKGQAVARLETPITRVATPPAEGKAQVDYVVVQPGNSLWRLARRLSGDGFNYVYIFEANQAQIRDPDVIYPGQVFEVPANVGAEIAG